MKKLITLFILIAGIYTAFGQSCDLTLDKITLNTLCSSLATSLPNDNTTLTARDAIVLVPGFNANANSFNGHSFTLKTDHSVANQNITYLASQVSGPDRTLDKTNCIPGSIGGSVDISASGAANYSLPILVSPGTHGMQPKLSIVYSSQSGNDILGYGWHLAGLSAISRVSKNNYYDGAISPVSLTSTDALAMDGQRLISTGTNAYSPENNPYTSVTYNGTSFTVTTQDGMVMEYGNTTDSRFLTKGASVPVNWAIDKITDPDGNYIQFIYSGDNTPGEYRINEINYTGNANAGLTPYNSVKFYYDKRADTNSLFIAGGQVDQSVILTSIKVFSENALSKDYEFSYFNEGLYSKLNQIALTADGVTYNPTIINWGTNNYTTTVTDAGTLLGSLNKNQLYFGDFNGDGRTDIASCDNKYTITISFAQAGGGYVTNTISLPPTTTIVRDPNYTLDETETTDTYVIKDVQIVDLNSDGQDEIMVHYTDLTVSKFTPDPHDNGAPPAHTNYVEYDNVNSYSFNGTGFNSSSKNHALMGSSSNTPITTLAKYQYFYADFNSDGNIDMLIVKNGALLSCSGMSVPSITNIDDIKIMDFDGDGQADFLTLTADGYGSIWGYNGTTFLNKYGDGTNSLFGKSCNLFTGDFNSDGKTDYLTCLDGTWYVNYSTGKGFHLTNAPSDLAGKDPALTGVYIDDKPDKSLYWYAYHFICVSGVLWSDAEVDRKPKVAKYKTASTVLIDDVNNDGKSDIILAVNGTVSVFISNGNSFLPEATINVSSVNSSDIMNIRLYAADFSNTGQKQLIYGNDDFPFTSTITLPPGNGSTCDGGWTGTDVITVIPGAATHENYKNIIFNDLLNSSLYVNTITDGLNNTSTFTYSNYNDNRPFGGSFPKPAFPLMLNRGPWRLATNLTTTNSSSVWANINYTFGDGYTHVQGLGFLGFKTMTVSNNLNNISDTSYYSYTIPNTSLYYTWSTSRKTQKGSTMLSTATNTISALGGDITKKFFKPIVTTSTSTDKLKNISSTNTVLTFNTTTGRVEDQKSTTSDGWSTETTASYATVLGNVTKLTQTITTSKNASDTYTTTTALGYDASKPLRAISKTDQGLITTNYTGFDPFGNATAISIVTADGTRSNSCTYDSKGRFVLSATNAAGYTSTSTSTYRSSDGSKLTETDPNGLTTTYSYLPQGNSISIITSIPGGAQKTSILAWDGSGNGLYYNQTQVTHGNISNTVTSYLNAGGQKLKETSLGYKGSLKTTVYTYNADGTANTVLSPGYTTPVTYTYNPSDGRLESTTGFNLNTSYSYSGNTATVTNNISGETKTQTYDALGNVTQATGTNGLVTYDYYASGKAKNITTGSASTSMTYDILGNQLTLTDPDAGTTTYTYNGFCQLQTQIDAKGQTITCSYDGAGRLKSKSGTGTNTSYTYFTTPGKLGLLQSVTRDGVSETYDYDNFCRPSTMTKTGAGKTFLTSCTYDNNNGALYHVVYPTGLTVEYGYDQVGNLSQIFDANNKTTPIWSGDSQNDRGQWTNFSMGNGLATTWGYDPTNNAMNSIQTGPSNAPTSIQNLGFTFNNQGQLTNRTDGSLSESFKYDPINRLTKSTVTGQTDVIVNYLNNGNIDNTSIGGQYSYLTNQPHAVQAVTGVTSTGQSPQLITTSSFTSDNKLSLMDNGTYKNVFTYGPDGNRFKLDMYNSGNLQSSKLYDGNSEFVLDNYGNITLSRTFIYAPTGICAVYEKDATNPANFYYIHTDYLGSWLAITDQQGSLTNRYSYDAWGRPRDPSTWQLKPVSITNALVDLSSMQPRFDRGYTGHEHMAGFGLINMNGRLYDPYLQRFLSPDNFVQDAANSQSYNRYTYCLNNPLMYTDPTGWYPAPHLGAKWIDVGGGPYRISSQSSPGSMGYSCSNDGIYFDNATGKEVDSQIAIDYMLNVAQSNGDLASYKGDAAIYIYATNFSSHKGKRDTYNLDKVYFTGKDGNDYYFDWNRVTGTFYTPGTDNAVNPYALLIGLTSATTESHFGGEVGSNRGGNDLPNSPVSKSNGRTAEKYTDMCFYLGYATTFVNICANGQASMKPVDVIAGKIGKVTGGAVLIYQAIKLYSQPNTTTGDWVKFGVDATSYYMTNWNKNGWVMGAGLVIGVVNRIGAFDGIYKWIDSK